MVVKAERGSRNRKAKSNSSRKQSITQLFPKSPVLPSYPRFSQGPKALSPVAGADSELGSAEGIALAPLLIPEVPLPEFSFSPLFPTHCLPYPFYRGEHPQVYLWRGQGTPLS